MIPGAAELIAALDARIPAEDTGTCRHCTRPIVFKPYFLDGKKPNPAQWWHPPGSITCSTKPKGWRSRHWPTAEPLETS